MKTSRPLKVAKIVALILLISAFFIPVVGFDYIHWTLYDLAKLNIYYSGVVILVSALALLGFLSKKCSLIAGIILLLLLFFFSVAKMHSPEYFLGYWLLLLSSVLLIFSSFVKR